MNPWSSAADQVLNETPDLTQDAPTMRIADDGGRATPESRKRLHHQRIERTLRERAFALQLHQMPAYAFLIDTLT